jgi:hypothetical protein
MGRRLRHGGGLALAIACAGCALAPAPEGGDEPDTLAIAFETMAAPQAFFVEGLAVADRPDGVPGFWATVPRLPRPERALIVNAATGASVEAALFAGGRSTAPIRLSGAVAEALGIGADPEPVRITALRREPRIVAP